jgi:hypothetical protein
MKELAYPELEQQIRDNFKYYFSLMLPRVYALFFS